MTNPKRSRALRILKWTGFAACVMFLLIGTVGFRWGVGYFYEGGQVLVAGGGVLVAHQPNVDTLGLRAFTFSAPKRPLWQRVRGFFWVPRIERHAVWVPLGLPLLLTMTVTVILFWQDRRRIDPGHCQQCGYNLTGNVSGKCPECGNPCRAEAGAK